jgi:uncharacterized Zn finger protein
MARRRSRYDNYYAYYQPTRPIETDEGIKARSRRGAFAKNWWADQWIRALERLMDSGRLSRGRTYARKGQVLSIEEKGDGIEARVQGSRRTPYRVTIQLTPLTDDQWALVVEALAEQALFAAQLLSGEMPTDIEEAFKIAGVSLFPEKHGDLVTNCSCPDWANPCKHVAATHYILGERFDEDPFLLFRLRGRSQEQILGALRESRAGEAMLDEDEDEVVEVIPLEESLAHFWEMGQSLEDLSVAIRPPSTETPLLKRLGEANFVPGPGLLSLLTPAYQAITQSAQKIAYQEESEEENDE